MAPRTQPRAGFRPVVVNAHPVRTTPRKQCTQFLPPITQSALPERCSDPVLKAGRCKEHYFDWRHSRETRQGTEAVNPERRARKALDLSGRQSRKRRKAQRRAAK